MNNEITEIKKEKTVVTSDNGLYLDTAKFEHAWRVANMLSASTMVPEQFQKNPGNCMIALNFAERTGMDPFMIMQKMYVIHGRPGIEGQLIIALINNTKKFSPLRFKLEGDGKTRKCTAYATSLSDNEVCSQAVTWDMVEKEGWDKKSGSKWKTMPDLMFQYRSAAFFGRMYCPEALLGMMSKEEIEDIRHEKFVPNISSANDAMIISDKKPEKQNFERKEYIEEPCKDIEKNPLRKTEAWKKYEQARDINPVFAATMPEPINEEQCISAAKAISLDIDKNA